MAEPGPAAHIPSLPALTLSFNLAPVGYVHESWYENLPHGELCKTLAGHPKARGRISQFLLQTLGLEGRYFCDFREPRMRLALLPPKLLESLFLYVGATLRNAEFRNELDGTTISLLRQVLGSDVMEYATKRVPLLGSVPAFSYEPDLSNDLRLRLVQIGAVYSLSAAAAQQSAYAGRLVLKLPHRLATGLLADLPGKAAEPESQGLPVVTRRIVREYLPPWLTLFA